MITTRNAAKSEYAAALKAWNVASSGTDEQAFAAATAKLNAARTALVNAEAQFPTAKEAAKAANILRLRNMGWDA